MIVSAAILPSQDPRIAPLRHASLQVRERGFVRIDRANEFRE